MKIILTTDTHIQSLRDPAAELTRFMDRVLAENADVFCVGGDLGEGNDGCDPNYRTLLGTHPTTLFVLGNHDLYRHRRAKVPPPEAMDINLKHFEWGVPLEKSWEDTETFYRTGDTVFVGSIGWPDFDHPLVRGQKAKYDRNSATIDPDYIDLERGWLGYTQPLQAAFEKRLALAFSQPCSTVIVLTHYPILEGQSALDPHDSDTWPYFFNWKMGQSVLALAQRHPQKRVWCLAGHSHEYCLGTTTQAAANVLVYGHRADYGELTYFIYDPEASGSKKAKDERRYGDSKL